MDLGEDQLPETYALALRLRRDGVDSAGIAERIGIEPEAVALLLHLAHAKLDRIKPGPGSALARAEDDR